MAVTWNWSSKMGEMLVKNDNPNCKNKTWKINMYTGGNCMSVLLYEYKDKATKKWMNTLYGWMDNVKHLKKHVDLYNNVTKMKLNTYYLRAGNELYKMAQVLTEAGIKVELFYKAPKNKKEK